MKLIAPVLVILRWLSVPEPRWVLYEGWHNPPTTNANFAARSLERPFWRTRAVVLALIIGIVLGAVGVSAVRARLRTVSISIYPEPIETVARRVLGR